MSFDFEADLDDDLGLPASEDAAGASFGLENSFSDYDLRSISAQPQGHPEIQEQSTQSATLQASNSIQIFPDRASNHIANISATPEPIGHQASLNAQQAAGHAAPMVQPAEASSWSNGTGTSDAPEAHQGTLTAPPNFPAATPAAANVTTPAEAADNGTKEETLNPALDQEEVDLLLEQARLSGCTVYIANMTWYTTDSDVLAACSEFGKVVGIKFVEDRFNGRSTGCATVEFADPESAASCKENMQGRTVHGKTIVTYFPAKNVQQQQPLPPPRPPPLPPGAVGGAAGGYMGVAGPIMDGAALAAGQQLLGSYRGGRGAGGRPAAGGAQPQRFPPGSFPPLGMPPGMGPMPMGAMGMHGMGMGMGMGLPGMPALGLKDQIQKSSHTRWICLRM
ncbi:hypothetical protein CEUSTIGMA_g5327.t1 [Chlamydomonas eustigma]|uniref:RRM domain-containing protein n=1 Tax=Chlamydomonas eustigma TaxID=1157962 RepID=A0A250X487_9CHLO|nr:hypothetical protein CEUSTIGMA_g5327.t1 [Chlamydomonas eustigma]|eukprot:GAX77885.1 hypothetical protein CEUSTIGMA_g5327.t1 [Chlamydomonas eustigma]